MKPTDYLCQFREWLEKADTNLVDAFANQNEFLVRHLVELSQRFTGISQNGKSMIIEKTSKDILAQSKLKDLNLDNAKQDEPYHYQYKGEFRVKDVSFSKDCNLTWDKETTSIKGIPLESGEIIVSFHIEDGSVFQAPLFINPNPKKLWNNIPSDKVSRFWKTDSANEEILTEKGKLIAARQRGRSHAHKGICCDDDFAIAYHKPTGMHFLAIADGAGSADFSREGSKIAVAAAKEKVLEQLNLKEKSYKDFPTFSTEDALKTITNAIFISAVQAAFSAQEKTARDADIELKSLSCTLLLAFTLQLHNGHWFTACYWVGDGAVAIFDPAQDQVTLLGEVDSGQYSGETQFLTFNETNPEQLTTRIRVDIRNDPPLLILMTDGVSDPKFQTDAKLHNKEIWKTFWQELNIPLANENAAKSLESWLDFFSKGEHDDRTLAIFLPESIYTEIINKTSISIENKVLNESIVQTHPEFHIERSSNVITEIANYDATLNIESEMIETKISLIKTSDKGNIQ